MKTHSRALGGALALLSLASCGGDDAAPPGSGPSNSAPSFAGGDQTVSVAENSSGVLFTATATDAEGSPITYTLSGEDADEFQIDAAGQVSFVQTPNFDRPEDADRNNTYQFSVVASDGSLSASVMASVTVTNSKEGVAVAPFSQFDDPGLVIAPVLQRDQLLAIGSDGAVIQLDAITGEKTSIGNIFEAAETGEVLAAAQDRSWIFVLMRIDGVGTVIRFRFATYPDAHPVTRVLDSGIDEDASGTLFYARGRLLAAIGDPGGTSAQDPTSGFGKLFQISFAPYCGASVYAVCLGSSMIGNGIHAPAGGVEAGGLALLFDRGTDRQDEISAFDPLTTLLDFGWPDLEGTYESGSSTPTGVAEPFLTLPRGEAFGESSGVTGGAAYAGGIASLSGSIIFGDSSGKIFAMPQSFATDRSVHSGTEVEERTEDFQPDAESLGGVRRIIAARSGAIFILNAEGNIYTVAE